MFNFLTGNRPLRVLIGINIIFVFGAAMFPPLFALFIKEIGGGVFSVGSIWAVFAIFTGILMAIFTRFGDKRKGISAAKITLNVSTNNLIKKVER